MFLRGLRSSVVDVRTSQASDVCGPRTARPWLVWHTIFDTHLDLHEANGKMLAWPLGKGLAS